MRRLASTPMRSAARAPHRYVLMCLVALEDPGLTVFPTHRLVSRARRSPARIAVQETINRDFSIEALSSAEELRRARPACQML